MNKSLLELVSVIIPTYNRRHLIMETLDSVAAQTYRPIELIVVDDGSTDGTADAVGAWIEAVDESQWKGLHFNLIRKPNGGENHARNVGLAAAQGEFIQFLDSDDLLHPEKIRLHVAKLREDDRLDFVYSACTPFDKVVDWNILPDARCSVYGDIVTHFVDNTLNTNLCLYRRDVCRKVEGWNEKISQFTDLDFTLRVIRAGGKAAYVPGVYIGYRDHAGPRGSRPSSARINLEAWQAVAEIVSHVSGNNRVSCRLADGFSRIALGALRTGEFAVAQEALMQSNKFGGTRSRILKNWVLGLLASNERGTRFRQKIAEWVYQTAGTRTYQQVISFITYGRIK